MEKISYCAFCNLSFALTQKEIVYKGKVWHGDCFFKVRAKERDDMQKQFMEQQTETARQFNEKLKGGN